MPEAALPLGLGDGFEDVEAVVADVDLTRILWEAEFK